MDNSKPDFWKECPQILGNWHNILYILSGLPVYYIAEKAKSGYSVLIALFVVVVLYAVSYFVRYRRYSREKDLPKTNDQDSDQDYHTLSVVYDRRDNNGKNYCLFTRTIESKVYKLKYIKYRYSVLGQSDKPNVSSSTHDISYKILPKNEDGWDVILILFKKPLRKGEIAEFSIEMNGTNCRDLQFCRVNTPIKQVVFDIKLIGKQSAPDAELIMIPIDGKTVNVVDKKETVRFQRKTSRYYIEIPNPQCGYTYQLNWGEEIKKKKSRKKI